MSFEQRVRELLTELDDAKGELRDVQVAMNHQVHKLKDQIVQLKAEVVLLRKREAKGVKA